MWSTEFKVDKLKVLSIVLIFVCLMVSATKALAQATRTLGGQIKLDVGVAAEDLQIDVTVNNHSFVVVPPSFTIIRPITSKQTRRVVIKQGEDSTSYFVDGIVTDPPAIDYTIRFQCVGCAEVFRTQYYAESGNRFGLANIVYLDPPTLGLNLDVDLVTDVSVSGQISLADSVVAARDLEYTILIVNSDDTSQVYRSVSNITLPEGQSSIDYRVTNLPRQASNPLFSVQLLCNNCFGSSSKPQTFPQVLNRNQNHNDVNFMVTDSAAIIVVPVVAPVVDLLLQ